MPNPIAAGRLRLAGTRACATRTAHPGTSVIFQIPEVRNNREITIAESQPIPIFQGGSSRPANIASAGAVPSCIILILSCPHSQPRSAHGRGNTAASARHAFDGGLLRQRALVVELHTAVSAVIKTPAHHFVPRIHRS